ncbi:MAG: glycosyltransferase family 2 protein [Rhodothermales bacterium]|nr:glycosyltransferase family 2 protein [Rhodothermales bacterium]
MTEPGTMVSILVVSYNTRELTLACLRSVIEETRVPYELIVVDNASSDGSAQAIANEFPQVRLLAERENHGFGKGNNLAAKHARGDYILLLNPDTVVLNSAIDKLVAFARATPDAKIWGGRTLFPDGTLNATSCFQQMTLWNVFCRASGLTAISRNHRFFSEAYGGWDMNDVRPVEIVTGCFLLMPRELWEELDGFDTSYFMYGEEVDLCLRATRQYGATPHFTPDATIIHYGGASEPVRADKLVRLFKAKLSLVRNHFPAWERPVGEHLLTMIPLSRYSVLSAVASVTGHQRARASAKVWGEVWARRAEWRDE